MRGQLGVLGRRRACHGLDEGRDRLPGAIARRARRPQAPGPLPAPCRARHAPAAPSRRRACPGSTPDTAECRASRGTTRPVSSSCTGRRPARPTSARLRPRVDGRRRAAPRMPPRPRRHRAWSARWPAATPRERSTAAPWVISGRTCIQPGFVLESNAKAFAARGSSSAAEPRPAARRATCAPRRPGSLSDFTWTSSRDHRDVERFEAEQLVQLVVEVAAASLRGCR